MSQSPLLFSPDILHVIFQYAAGSSKSLSNLELSCKQFAGIVNRHAQVPASNDAANVDELMKSLWSLHMQHKLLTCVPLQIICPKEEAPQVQEQQDDTDTDNQENDDENVGSDNDNEQTEDEPAEEDENSIDQHQQDSDKEEVSEPVQQEQQQLSKQDTLRAQVKNIWKKFISWQQAKNVIVPTPTINDDDDDDHGKDAAKYHENSYPITSVKQLVSLVTRHHSQLPADLYWHHHCVQEGKHSETEVQFEIGRASCRERV